MKKFIVNKTKCVVHRFDPQKMLYVKNAITDEYVSKNWTDQGRENVEIVFLNACEIGEEESLKAFQKAFGAKCIVGYKNKADAENAQKVAKMFFDLLSKGKTTAYEAFKKAFEVYYNDDNNIFGTDFGITEESKTYIYNQEEDYE